jgi:hypothetical protein
VRRWVVWSAVFSLVAFVGCSGDDAPQASRHDAPRAPAIDGWVVLGDRVIAVDATPDGPPLMATSLDGGRTWRRTKLPGAPPKLALSKPHAGAGVVTVVGRDTAQPANVPVGAEFDNTMFVWTSADGLVWRGATLELERGFVTPPSAASAAGLLLVAGQTRDALELFVSSDRGGTWRRARVVPEGVSFPPLARAWREGGRLSLLAQPDPWWQTPRIGVGTTIFVSDDRGATWRALPCPEGCPDGLQADGLATNATGRLVSKDGGPWRPVKVDGRAPGDKAWCRRPDSPGGDCVDPPVLKSLVAVDGGWLAVAGGSVEHETTFEMLLRSSDGHSWRQTLPSDPCAKELSERQSTVSQPELIDGHWYVTYNCWTYQDPNKAAVYVGNREGDRFQLVAGTEQERVTLGIPLAFRGGVLVAESPYGLDSDSRGVGAVYEFR